MPDRDEMEGGVMKKARDIDSKFATSIHGEIYKKSNEEFVPDDEPLFLLRARDMLSLNLLHHYKSISISNDCNDYHFENLDKTIEEFVKFKKEHPERMKMPSTTKGK
jgi:hypothetical protein